MYKRQITNSIKMTKKEADTKAALAELFASSPFLSQKQKDMYIRKMGFKVSKK